MADIRDHVLFGLLGLLGAFAFALVGINRGEPVNALWIVIAAIAVLPHRLSLLFAVHRASRHAARPDAAYAGGAPQ